MPSFQDGVNPGLFISTTPIFDVTDLEGKSFSSSEFQQFLVVLTQRINDLSIQINLKDTGIYSELEFVNSQVFFPNPAWSSITSQYPTQRQVFRKVINFIDGTTVLSLPNTGTTSVPHGITIDANTSFTRIYGAASDPSTSFIPLPYASPTAANNIELDVDAVNVNITTGSDRTGYTICYIILEYIKQ